MIQVRQIKPVYLAFGRTIICPDLLTFLLTYLRSMNCAIKNSDVLIEQLCFEYSRYRELGLILNTKSSMAVIVSNCYSSVRMMNIKKLKISC